MKKIDESTLVSFALSPSIEPGQKEAEELQKPAEEESAGNALGRTGDYKQLDLGLTKRAKGKVELKQGQFDLIDFRSDVQNLPWWETLPLKVVASLVTFIMIKKVVVATSLSSLSSFLLIVTLLPLVWSFPTLLRFAAFLLDMVNTYPRCRSCGRHMVNRNKWTRFVKTEIEVKLGYRDCLAAIQHGFYPWRRGRQTRGWVRHEPDHYRPILLDL